MKARLLLICNHWRVCVLYPLSGTEIQYFFDDLEEAVVFLREIKKGDEPYV